MGISDGMQSVAEFRVVGMSGCRGLGISRLQFATECEIQATAGRTVLVTSPICFAHAGPSTDALRPLGRTSVETSWYTQTGEHSRREGLSVFVDLAGEQLEALERVRDGRSLIFRLDMHAIVQSQARGLQRGFQQIFYEANLSTWSKVLKELGYMEFLLLAVELPIEGIPESLKDSVGQIRKAYLDLVSGQWDSVVSRARLVLDAIDAVSGGEQKRGALMKEFAASDTREAMNKRQRADLARAALRHYTHLAHHTDKQGTVATFGRTDAMFAITGAAAALWDAIGRSLD